MNTTSSHELALVEVMPYTPLVSKAVLNEIIPVVAYVLGAVSCFGVLANIINIIVFITQGLKDSITTSLLALSVSDLVVTSCSLCMSPCLVWGYLYLPGLVVRMLDVFYQIVSVFNMFSRTSGCLAAFVAFERCLAVVLPLKVGQLITVRRTIVILCMIYLVNITTSAGTLYMRQHGFVFDPVVNMTVLGTVHIKNIRQVSNALLIVNINVILPCFLAVNSILTLILVVKLKKKSKWRLGHSNKGNSDNPTDEKKVAKAQKDTRVAKMVTFLSFFNIACFMPSVMLSVSKYIEPELRKGRKEENLELLFRMNFIFFQTVNASFNILIYLSMSTLFRKTLGQICPALFNTDDKTQN